MWELDLSWEEWRAVIDFLRGTDLSYAHQHANIIERQLDQHPPDPPLVRLVLTDDVFYRSITLAAWRLGIPLPKTER